MAIRSDITPELLRQLLRYEPETGKLFWKKREVNRLITLKYVTMWNKRYEGKEAFVTECKGGYLRGAIHNIKFLAHRVAWAVHYGAWPEGEIDHANGITYDNRIENLRDVSHATNMFNQKIPIDNESGHIGVSRYLDRWRARICVGGKQVHLGHFIDKAEAIKARANAEREFGFHPNHGRQV